MLEAPVPTNGHGWAVVYLTDTAENAPVTEIDADLTRHLPACQYFFPAVLDGRLRKDSPVSTYVFATSPEPQPKFWQLERSRYVETILRTANRRAIARITDDELATLAGTAARHDRLLIGQSVLVLAGDWSGLEGRVVDNLKGGKVKVFIELYSKKHVLTLARHEIQIL